MQAPDSVNSRRGARVQFFRGLQRQLEQAFADEQARVERLAEALLSAVESLEQVATITRMSGAADSICHAAAERARAILATDGSR